MVKDDGNKQNISQTPHVNKIFRAASKIKQMETYKQESHLSVKHCIREKKPEQNTYGMEELDN
jgi:hypothetical protein